MVLELSNPLIIWQKRTFLIFQQHHKHQVLLINAEMTAASSFPVSRVILSRPHFLLHRAAAAGSSCAGGPSRCPSPQNSHTHTLN